MIALLLFIPVLGFGCAWWAWGYHQRALRVLRVRSSLVQPRANPVPADPRREARVPQEPETATARAAVQQLERAVAAPASEPCSVLGWEAFSLFSTLVLDGTVLLGCRRQPDEFFAGGRTRRRANLSRPTAEESGTLVLLIGEDELAVRAVEILEQWRTASVTLRLRPTAVAGAIEVFDGRRSAIRAALLAT
ncbi:MAG: hypothetical protein M3083_02670 [Actinomycetota bacterium]|nr:hypothetical protein [Actinomycetota bacterium]